MSIEVSFKKAALESGIKLLADMQAPVEIRKEGTLTAVSRMLWLEGEQTNHPAHPNGIAPDLYEQFRIEFKKLQSRYVAFFQESSHQQYNLDKDGYETRYIIRYAYIK